MATRGTKTTSIAGASVVALLAGATVAFWDDVEIEWQIRRLHSEDEATREAAARSLASYGDRVMPRLLDDLRDHDRDRPARSGPPLGLQGRSAIDSGDAGKDFPCALEQGVERVIYSIGAPAFLHIIRGFEPEASHSAATILFALADYVELHSLFRDWPEKPGESDDPVWVGHSGVRSGPSCSAVTSFRTQLLQRVLPSMYLIASGGIHETHACHRYALRRTRSTSGD